MCNFRVIDAVEQQLLSRRNRFDENVADLDAVPPAGARLLGGAPKHGDGTGGPARVFAMV